MRADTATRYVLWPSVAATLAFAFAVTWNAGHRGVFLMDHSLIFDGAWRILQGQAPYRDFYMAYGPMTFWLQALFFKLFGVTFSSMVLSASVGNVIATASIMRIGRLLTTSYPPPVVGCILTAICFQPPFC